MDISTPLDISTPKDLTRRTKKVQQIDSTEYRKKSQESKKNCNQISDKRLLLCINKE